MPISTKKAAFLIEIGILLLLFLPTINAIGVYSPTAENTLSSDGYTYLNFTKLTHATSFNFTAEFLSGSKTNFSANSIDLKCLNQTKLMIRAKETVASSSGAEMTMCYNGTQWYNMTTNPTGNGRTYTGVYKVQIYSNATIEGNINSEITDTQIFETVNYLITNENTGMVNSGSTDTGALNISLDLAPTGNYVLILTSPNSSYTQKNYYITTSNSSVYTQTFRILPTASSSGIGINVRDRNSVGIYQSLLTIQRNYGGTWYTVSQAKTDAAGYGLINMQDTNLYRITIEANGYNPFTEIKNFYAANQPYNYLLGSTLGNYQDFNNNVSFAYSPINSTLPNGSLSFSLTSYSAPGIIASQTIRTPLNITNSSGTPQGMTTTVNFNTVPYQGSTLNVEYCIAANGYSNYCFTIKYYVEGYNKYSSNLAASLDNFAAQNQDKSSKLWLAIAATFACLAFAVIVFQLSQGNSLASTISAFLGMCFFGYMGWLDAYVVVVVVTIVVIMYFYSRTGGSGY